jgi:peptidoglycan/LPS O-acetylase OafA/YrhL
MQRKTVCGHQPVDSLKPPIAKRTSMTAHAPGSQPHINAIDGLRALAVLSVMVYHLNSNWLHGGFIGVDLFFVISGYVVTRSILCREWACAREFFTVFIARRIARIYPALIVCLLLVTITLTLVVPKAWLNDTSYKAAAAAFFGLSNFILVYFTDGYFSQRSEYNPFTHTWSLGIEEQFYVLFALTWWFTRKSPRIFLVTMACSIVISLGLSAWLTNTEPALAYYLLPSRWWELALGATLAHAHQHRPYRLYANAHAVGLVACGLLCIGYAALYADTRSFPFPDAIYAAVGGLFCIHGLVHLKPGVTTLGLASAPLVHIGKVSYSLYLWHWPVIVFFKWTVGLETGAHYAACLGLTIVFSYLSFFLVEKPMRHGLIRSFTSSRLVTRGVIVMAAGSITTILMFFIQPVLSLSVTSDTNAWYSRPSSNQRDWKNRSDKPVIYALGDSHAGILGVALQELEGKMDIESKIITESGCSVVSLRALPTEHCQVFVDSIIPELVQRFRPGDTVILISQRSQRISDQWGLIEGAVEKNQPNPDILKQSQKYADTIIKQLLDAGFKVVLSAPMPMFYAPAFRCSDIFNQTNPVCQPGLEVTQQDALKWRESTMEQIQVLKAKHSKMIVWDPFFDVCPHNPCKAVDNEPLFFDGDHLTGAGNRRVLPSLTKALSS